MTEDFKAVYRLGVKEGENRFRIFLDKLQKANGLLFETLIKFDKYLPLLESTETFVIPRKKIKQIITKLRRHKEYSLVNYLREILTVQTSKKLDSADKIQSVLKRKTGRGK